MNPTWVMALPTGEERGVFLTMDMGGTNFRVCKVELLGSGKYDSTQMDTKIPDAVKSGTAQQLWLFIIDCLRKFLTYHAISDHELRKIPLAFTFSYPVTQTSVRDGVLQRWTKGFDISGVEGHDVTAELQRALNENASLLSTSV
jgi:hexokinase